MTNFSFIISNSNWIGSKFIFLISTLLIYFTSIKHIYTLATVEWGYVPIQNSNAFSITLENCEPVSLLIQVMLKRFLVGYLLCWLHKCQYTLFHHKVPLGSFFAAVLHWACVAQCWVIYAYWHLLTVLGSVYESMANPLSGNYRLRCSSR